MTACMPLHIVYGILVSLYNYQDKALVVLDFSGAKYNSLERNQSLCHDIREIIVYGE
jgi:hypothetical protein